MGATQVGGGGVGVIDSLVESWHQLVPDSYKVIPGMFCLILQTFISHFSLLGMCGLTWWPLVIGFFSHRA